MGMVPVRGEWSNVGGECEGVRGVEELAPHPARRLADLSPPSRGEVKKCRPVGASSDGRSVGAS
jgi:hypothetical protein